MKLYTRFLTALLAFAVGLSACGPEELELGEAPNPEEVTFSYKVDEENANIIHFTNTSKAGFKAMWDFDNGVKNIEGDQVTGEFAVKGDYEVKMTLYNRGGSATRVETISIEKTNALMLNREDYNLLTGGAEELEGKKWVVDKTVLAHLALGPVEGYSPDWYKAAPLEKEGLGLYDDVFTFKLQDFAYEQQTNGDIFANQLQVEGLGGTFNGEDQKIAYTAPEGLTWTISEDADGKKFITISDGGFIGYYTGVSTYEILSLEENAMHLRFIDTKNAALAWYLKLIPEGYEHPVEEPEYTAKDLFDDFDGNQAEALAWYTDEVAGFAAGYDNPATFGVNTSAKVAKYVRGEGDGNMWNNVQVQLDYKIDLTTRNKFKVKVFLPSYNTYTYPDSVAGLKPMIALKLQNSDMGGDAWRTQVTVQHTGLEEGVWHELEFDFTDATNIAGENVSAADRTDFDKIVLQIGGEGHTVPGTFFFDDFELL